MGKEEAASRAEVVEEEQLLVLSNLAVIAFGSLGKEDFVVGQLLLIWEGDSVDALQGVVVGVAQEI
jgi:hypothetical protein